MTEDQIREKAKIAQKELLNAVLDFFKKHKKVFLGPADITRELSLFKGLNQETSKKYGFTGTQNDRIAQGFINQLLRQDKIKRVKNDDPERKKWKGYQYKEPKTTLSSLK